MEEIAKTLQGLKVPELKAKCKELKIPNFSKLSKADLIAKILELSTTTTVDLSSRPPPSKTLGPSIITPIVTDADATNPGHTTDLRQAKEGKVDKAPTKRKVSDEPPPEKKQKAKIATTSINTTRESTPVFTEVQSPLTNTLTSADASTTPAPPVRIVPPKTKTVAARPTSKLKPNAITAPSSISQAQEKSSRPKPRTVVQSVKARPRFQGLTQTKTPRVAPRPIAPELFAEPELASAQDRIDFIESHFLNTLFTLLHKYRAKAITGPQYPCPSSFTQSPSYKSSSHLAFQGFHPDVYAKTDARGFMVALGFWIARLHSYMQLGSGEAWSSNAREMGLLGPDLATWPPVMSVIQVTEEIWAVNTEEEGKKVKYLVIGEIGEVVASSKDAGDGVGLIHGCRVRGDWAKHLEQEPAKRKKLASMVKTKDSYAFPAGVSSAWSAGPGQAKHLAEVGYRAVMASCALNSFSGEKLSSLAMDAAYLGRPAAGVLGSDDLDLYLPESSQVLSVHRPANLHSSLAIVHRSSGYSEYVLAETGQVVGVEDEGVVSLYQGLVGCDYKGSEDSTGQAVFWKGWESRMKFIG